MVSPKQRFKFIAAWLLIGGLLGAALPICAQTQTRERRDIFSRSLNGKLPGEYIEHLPTWRLAKKRAVEEAFAALSAETKAELVKMADRDLSFSWPALPASEYLEFKVTGNRTNFQSKLARRRAALWNLIAGELVTREGKYLPQIVNGLWATLEESTWVLPAHIVVQKSGSGLPDPAETIVDLVSAETSAHIAWTHLLLGDELAKVSPILPKRMLFELNRRTAQPYLERDFGWMGFRGGMVNNWNIWINTNVLRSALFTIDDRETLDKIVDKTMRSADNFVNYYGDDGGSDEGPAYWAHAGAKLIQFVEMLQEVSGDRLNYRGEQIVRRMGEYIYKMHIDDNRFVNFADASASLIPPPEDVFTFGKLYGDETMKNFAGYLFRLKYKDPNDIGSNEYFTEFIRELMVRDELKRLPAKAPFAAEGWLPDLQVATLRELNGSGKGLFVAIQGGHNAESHNHNDVGNFVVYVDGEPAIIDVGVATYTRQTFSSARYELWHTQSAWHNCPTINGVTQKDGRQFRARDVKYLRDGSKTTLSMDIAGAYPAAAAVNQWIRKFVFDPVSSSLTLNEKYGMSEWKEPVVLNFMSAVEARETGPGKLLLQGSKAAPLLQIEYDPKTFQWKQEIKPLDDERLTRVWGNKIYRITLTGKTRSLNGEHSIRFVKALKSITKN